MPETPLAGSSQVESTRMLASFESPRAYIEWLLEELPNAGELDDETVDRFMPWSPEVPERLMITKDAAERLAATIEEPIMDIDPGTLSKDR